MKENKVVPWLKNFFKKDCIEEKSLEPILYFSLLWNLFEHTYSKYPYQINPGILKELSDKSYIDVPDFPLDLSYNHFKSRYIKNDEVTYLFRKLLLTEENKKYCINVLLKNEPRKKDKMKCVFLIIHRFRNNLFHGNKNPVALNLYSDQFKVINSFLMTFIEATSEKHRVRR